MITTDGGLIPFEFYTASLTVLYSILISPIKYIHHTPAQTATLQNYTGQNWSVRPIFDHFAQIERSPQYKGGKLSKMNS